VHGLPVPPYTLGALLGDGCLTSTSKNITSDDPEVVARIEAEVGCALNRPGPRAHVRTPSYIIPFSTGVKTALGSLGLLGTTSADKFIPARYLQASIPDRWELLRGLLDTDASVKRNGTAEFMTESPRLAQDIAWLARSLGGFVSAGEKNTSYRDGSGDVIDCGRGHRVLIKFPDLANAFALPRKKGKRAFQCTPGRAPRSGGSGLSH
jgi:hypothetical protein